MMKVSVVIPCYNSENTITNVVEKLVITIEKKFDYEIILINDGSKDNVWKKIEELSNNNDKIIGINLAKNYGQHSALMAGYNNCNGDIIVSMDDDGQTPPESVINLIDALDEETDVIYAKYCEINKNKLRSLGTFMNAKMAELLIGKPKELYLSSYFVAKRFIIEEIINYKGSYPYIPGLVLRVTDKIKNVIVEHKDRISGKSGYSLKKLLKLWFNGFTAFSVKPLRVADVIGIIIAIIGFIYAIYIILIKLFSNNIIIPGYSSLMSIILIIGGIIMTLIGIVGEYIGRIYICINNSPQYVIKEKTIKK